MIVRLSRTAPPCPYATVRPRCVRGSREKTFEMCLHDPVALTRLRLQLATVENENFTSAISNHSLVLPLSRHDGDRRSPNREHRSEILLREPKAIMADPVMRHQQPSRAALLAVGEGVASSVLARQEEEV